jgi:hypothetical protein
VDTEVVVEPVVDVDVDVGLGRLGSWDRAFC